MYSNGNCYTHRDTCNIEGIDYNNLYNDDRCDVNCTKNKVVQCEQNTNTCYGESQVNLISQEMCLLENACLEKPNAPEIQYSNIEEKMAAYNHSNSIHNDMTSFSKCCGSETLTALETLKDIISCNELEILLNTHNENSPWNKELVDLIRPKKISNDEKIAMFNRALDKRQKYISYENNEPYVKLDNNVETEIKRASSDLAYDVTPEHGNLIEDLSQGQGYTGRPLLDKSLDFNLNNSGQTSYSRMDPIRFPFETNMSCFMMHSVQNDNEYTDHQKFLDGYVSEDEVERWMNCMEDSDIENDTGNDTDFSSRVETSTSQSDENPIMINQEVMNLVLASGVNQITNRQSNVYGSDTSSYDEFTPVVHCRSLSPGLSLSQRMALKKFNGPESSDSDFSGQKKKRKVRRKKRSILKFCMKCQENGTRLQGYEKRVDLALKNLKSVSFSEDSDEVIEHVRGESL